MGLWSRIIAKLHLFGARRGLREPLLTCREVIDFIEAFRTGELPAEQRREFQIHIDVCPPCVSFLDTYETTIKLEKCCRDDSADIEVPPELIKAILASREK